MIGFASNTSFIIGHANVLLHIKRIMIGVNLPVSIHTMCTLARALKNRLIVSDGECNSVKCIPRFSSPRGNRLGNRKPPRMAN